MSKKASRKLTKRGEKATRQSPRSAQSHRIVKRVHSKPFVSKIDLEKLDPEFRRLYKGWLKVIARIDARMERLKAMRNSRQRIK